jgi:hypothetical protein
VIYASVKTSQCNLLMTATLDTEKLIKPQCVVFSLSVGLNVPCNPTKCHCGDYGISLVTYIYIYIYSLRVSPHPKKNSGCTYAWNRCQWHTSRKVKQRQVRPRYNDFVWIETSHSRCHKLQLRIFLIHCT